MPSVLLVSSSTIIPADTASSAWLRTHFGRERTVVTLLWKSSLCPAAWWKWCVPCGHMAGNSLEANRGPPGHCMPQCSTSAHPRVGTLPVCTAWEWAVGDWPLPTVPTRTQCGMKKHTGWEQGDQKQSLRNGRPKNGPIWRGRTHAW